MEERPRNLRGLYRNVQVSVSTLNRVILGGIAALILVLFIGLQNPGYTVTFDSCGGTPVESQRLMYGDRIELPEPPTREGYRFAGWYRDAQGNLPWDPEHDTVSEPVTLYALWLKLE